MELEEKLDMMFSEVVTTRAYTWRRSQEISQNLAESNEAHSNDINIKLAREVGEQDESSHSKCSSTLGPRREKKTRYTSTFTRDQITQLV